MVRSNAVRNEILSADSSTMKVAVAAPAEKGRANLELIRFLSKKLKCQVRIVSGFEKKAKIIEISG
jgi:uncharacterized protein (TIGR00251 family)